MKRRIFGMALCIFALTAHAAPDEETEDTIFVCEWAHHIQDRILTGQGKPALGGEERCARTTKSFEFWACVMEELDIGNSIKSLEPMCLEESA